jgi:hypothetical protein
MSSLADVLERFNRKERNLLIRDILDCRGKAPRLAEDFCERLANAVGISKESLGSAWWATDFHFDWLAGALLTFMKGEILSPQDNSSMLVMGNQEDTDLVVVAHVPAAETPDHLILIEAKAYGHFTTKQYRSKMNRLERLHRFYVELERESPHKISFHQVLYSPTEPTRLVPQLLPWQSDLTTEPKHIHLEFTLPNSPTLTVKRCKAKDVSDIKRVYWRCIRQPPHEDATSEVPSFPSSDAPADCQSSSHAHSRLDTDPGLAERPHEFNARASHSWGSS